METGAKLKELRTAAGLSREDVATSLGVTVFTIGHWETGRRKPRFNMIQKLAKLYNASSADIMGDGAEESDDDSKINFLDKVITEFINEGILGNGKLFNDLDDTNKQILVGALDKHILKIIKTATEE